MARTVVVGATGGIGGAIARRVRARGGDPFLIARDPARLAALAADLGAPFAVADVLDAAALRAAIAEAGEIEGLAYAVGSILLNPLNLITEVDMVDTFRLNAVGAVTAVAAAAPALAASGRGSVVLFSSVAARHGFGMHAAIGAAKASVEGLTVSLAAELAPKVRVNCVAPSLTRTRIAEPMTRSPAMAEGIARAHPIPRLGEPDDVAAMADFLLSDASGWITGQVMAVDGGRSAIPGKG